MRSGTLGAESSPPTLSTLLENADTPGGASGEWLKLPHLPLRAGCCLLFTELSKSVVT